MTDYRKATTVAFLGTTVPAKTLVPGSGRGQSCRCRRRADRRGTPPTALPPAG
jgi:hypothetical protein